MAIEIERKFLVDQAVLGELEGGRRISQGFLPTSGLTVVRVRIRGDDGFLTIKGENVDCACTEFEYAIPLHDAQQMIDELCVGGVIDKTRFEIKNAGHVWEVDVFHGDNEGLVIAEVELSSVNEAFDRPPWLGEEVSGQTRYYNVNLLEHPYARW